MRKSRFKVFRFEVSALKLHLGVDSGIGCRRLDRGVSQN